MRYNNNTYESLTPVANEKLNYRDIKPAIRVRKIIDAIESTYDEIDFTGEFFNSADFHNLYLWMHREKGFMSNADEGGGLNVLQGKFHLPDDVDSGISLNAGQTEMRPLVGAAPGFFGFTPGILCTLQFDITTFSVDDTFNLRVYKPAITTSIGGFDFTVPEFNYINLELTGSTYLVIS